MIAALECESEMIDKLLVHVSKPDFLQFVGRNAGRFRGVGVALMEPAHKRTISRYWLAENGV